MNTSRDFPDGRQPIGASSAGLALLTSMLWGGTPVAIKYSQDVLPPLAVAAIRFALAALFMLAWCRIVGTGWKLVAGESRPCLVAGLLLFVQIGLFHLGLHHSSPSHGSLLINTFVLWVAAIEHFVTRTDRLSPRRIAGLVIAASGVAMVLTLTQGNDKTASAGLDQPSLFGDLILVASGFLLAIKIIYTKQAVRRVPPARLILWHDVIGLSLFAVSSILFEDVIDSAIPETMTLAATGGLLYQGLIVAGFCFAVQTRLLQRHPAARLAVFAFSTPLFGVAIAAFFREGAPSPWLIVAGLAVAVGISLVNWKESSGTS